MKFLLSLAGIWTCCVLTKAYPYSTEEMSRFPQDTGGWPRNYRFLNRHMTMGDRDRLISNYFDNGGRKRVGSPIAATATNEGAFSSWGGKRDSREAYNNDLLSEDVLDSKRTPSFSSWGGKRQSNRFYSWGGKRSEDNANAIVDTEHGIAKRAIAEADMDELFRRFLQQWTASKTNKKTANSGGKMLNLRGRNSIHWGGKRNAIAKT